MGTRTQPPAAQDLTPKTRNSLVQDPVAAVSAAAAVKSFSFITVGSYISLLYTYHFPPQKFKSFSFNQIRKSLKVLIQLTTLKFKGLHTTNRTKVYEIQ